MKVIVIGQSTVGKTNLLLRYTKDVYAAQKSTIGLSFVQKSVVVDGQQVKLQLWDTAGQEQFKSITRQFYSNAEIGIVVFDLSSPSTLKSCEMWLAEF